MILSGHKEKMVSPSHGRWPQEEPTWLHLDHELVASLKATQGRTLKATLALGIDVTNLYNPEHKSDVHVFFFKCVHVCVEVWSLRHGFTVQVRGHPQAWSSPFTFFEAKSLLFYC